MLSLGYFTKLFKKSFRDSSPHTLRRNVNTILASQRTILESSTTLWLMIVWKSPGQHEPPDPYMILMILSSITFCKLVNTFLSYILHATYPELGSYLKIFDKFLHPNHTLYRVKISNCNGPNDVFFRATIDNLMSYHSEQENVRNQSTTKVIYCRYIKVCKK